MKTLQENMAEFKKQLEKGTIQKAYLGLMEYMMSLKNHFSSKYPDYSTSGSLYNGYMDMTYFSIFPRSLKDRDLKIAIVFLYDMFRFAIWLSGKNKRILAKYWRSLKDRDLKIAIVFLYDTFRFEIWLSGKNKRVLAEYWQIISTSKWKKYKIVEPAKGVDSVVEHILADKPDFSDLNALTKQIEQGTLKFIQDIERFLAKTAT